MHFIKVRGMFLLSLLDPLLAFLCNTTIAPSFSTCRENLSTSVPICSRLKWLFHFFPCSWLQNVFKMLCPWCKCIVLYNVIHLRPRDNLLSCGKWFHKFSHKCLISNSCVLQPALCPMQSLLWCAGHKGSFLPETFSSNLPPKDSYTSERWLWFLLKLLQVMIAWILHRLLYQLCSNKLQCCFFSTPCTGFRTHLVYWSCWMQDLVRMELEVMKAVLEEVHGGMCGHQGMNYR